LDPSTAYNYYTSNEADLKPTPKGLSALVPNKLNLQRWKKGLANWLD
jgi:hypothetical protein